MDLNFLIRSWDDNGVMNSQKNWTKPFLNHIVQKFNNSLAGPQRFNNDASVDDPSPEQTLIVFSLLIFLFIKQVLIKENTNSKTTVLSTLHPINSKLIFCLASYLLFLVIFPILISLLVVTFVYRQIVKVVLKLKYKNKFVKLMDGTDAIWAIEEDKAKSIINVIATVQVKGANELLEKLQLKIKEKFMSRSVPYPKVLYKKSFELGYSFWEENNELTIEDYIRPLSLNVGEVSKDDLTKAVSELCNTDLPYNNKATWEILVGQNPMKESFNKNSDDKHYPILFRIHHSLGDGVVLIKLLLKSIADEGKTKMKRQMSIIIPIDDMKSNLKELFCFSNLNKLKDIIVAIIKMVYKIVKIVLRVPTSLVGQLMRPEDDNILHAKELEGVKLCTWLKEDDFSEGVLKKIKEIKSRMHGSTFSDLFVTALSASYHKYFQQNSVMKNSRIPDKITAIVPIRVEKSDLNLDDDNDSLLKLENRFTVAMLTIPIKVGRKSDSTKVTHLKRLAAVKKETSDLKNGADFYVNYFVMSLVGHVFPEPILRPMLKSEQASLVVSNLPGPSNVSICGGHKILDIAFVIPNRGTTGMGVTMLSYNGRVNLGFVADRAVINNVKDAEQILRGALEELDELDAITSKLMSSPSNSFEIHSQQK